MTSEQIKKLVKGRIFSVIFTKKNGEERKILCRLDVKKHLKGGEKKYDTEALNYLTVYSLDSKGYRTINLSTLKQIKANREVINL